LVSGRKTLAFYCLDTGNGFNNDDDVSLEILEIYCTLSNAVFKM